MLNMLLAAVIIIVAVPACWMLFYAAILMIEWRQSRNQQRCECCDRRADALVVIRKHWLCLGCAKAFSEPLEVGPREVTQIESDLERARR